MVRLMALPPTGPRRVTVLGAGIQGCCAALALARDGWDVTLVDHREAPWSETSLRGEGKLHLGYVYANEPDRATSALMIDAAMSFAPLLDGWLTEPVDWAAASSTPFAYAVHEDTMVDVGALADHYAWVDARVAETSGSYAGRAKLAPARQVDPSAVGLAGPIRAAFLTSEIAISPRRIRASVVHGLAELGVTYRGGLRVDAVERSGDGFVVRAIDSACSGHALPSDAVVNCLWHDRRRVDATLGLHDSAPVLLRLKFGLHGHYDGGRLGAPSTTVVLGPFGDVVEYSDGRAYVSWYPACMTDTAGQGGVPSSWQDAIDGTIEPARRADLIERSTSALLPILPGLESLVVDTVAAGVIVAEGATDIDDPASRLHRRDRIGVRHVDGYVTVETGKLTSAPRNAANVVEVLRS
jgi:hypothetical protein